MKKSLPLLLLCASAPLGAQSILIDFGKQGQETAGNWNNYAPNSNFTDNIVRLMLEDMIDSTGAATSIDMYFIDFSSGASSGIGAADFNVATTIGQPQSATRDTMYLNRTGHSVSATFELRDLTPNASYDLTFYAGIDAERNDTDWTVGGTTVSLNPDNNTSQTVTIFGAQANNSGVISIQWDSNNTAAHWNTFQITAVPEPAAYGLLTALAATSAVVLRRRR